MCGDTESEEADFGHDVESTITKAQTEGVHGLSGFGSLVQSGVLADHEAKALERHSRSPATRAAEARLALTRMGRSIAAEAMLEALEIDASAITEAERTKRAAWAKHEAAYEKERLAKSEAKKKRAKKTRTPLLLPWTKKDPQ